MNSYNLTETLEIVGTGSIYDGWVGVVTNILLNPIEKAPVYTLHIVKRTDDGACGFALIFREENLRLTEHVETFPCC